MVVGGGMRIFILTSTKKKWFFMSSLYNTIHFGQSDSVMKGGCDDNTE